VRGLTFASDLAADLLLVAPDLAGCLTLKITVQNGGSDVTMKLEGRVVGAWANELERVWRSFAPSLGPKKLAVDLRGVTYVSPDGRRILADIYRSTGAQFLADTPLGEYFVKEVTQHGKPE